MTKSKKVKNYMMCLCLVLLVCFTGSYFDKPGLPTLPPVKVF